MLLNKVKVAWILILVSCFAYVVPHCHAQQAKRPFTVADEIGLTLFDNPDGGGPALHFSPDGKYFAVWSERGRLDLNLVEDSLRFYRSEDIEEFLTHSKPMLSPSPIWTVSHSGKVGPRIHDWRWLADSSGVAFLEGEGYYGERHLVLADVSKTKEEPLTSTADMVESFDIRDRHHYVYVATNLAEREKWQTARQAPAIVGTGHSVFELLFPDIPWWAQQSRNRYLTAVVGGKPFKVIHKGEPFVPGGEFALSPDGASLVTTLPAGEVPKAWETLYPPPSPSSPYNHIHAGRVDVKQYVRINLQSSIVESLTGAPIARDGGWWWGGSGPSWSSTGQEILLPGTFIKAKDNAPSRPCVAVVDLRSNTSVCVETLKIRTETTVEEGYHTIEGAEFETGGQQVMVRFYNRQDESHREMQYRRGIDGEWQVAGQFKVGRAEWEGLEIEVKQGLNDPPLLVATKNGVSWVIWDPNPQLMNLELGEASVYTWKDQEGREWKGGLYRPVNYKRGRRYPLVVQNHGFDESKFLPSGVFPTAFAARALASQGIAVLQVGTSKGLCHDGAEEASCMASGYESAAKQLAFEALIDPDRIGIIGFSRTCYYVIQTLAFGSFPFKAASITDGVLGDYFQYMLDPERFGREYDAMIGAPPFGAGLPLWLKRSPGFNLDKVNTPVLVVGEGRDSLLFVWELYAALRYLRKPVDLMMLNTEEHVLSNPAVRMASQDGSVDWFRFWLQDYEDPDPAKTDQYKRWRELKKMQEENDAKDKAANEKPAPMN